MTISSVLRTKDKIGYGLGDMASALVWQTATLFLAYFYTDVFGLPAAIMGTMFLVVRVVDAFVDPCIGALVDRTQTRHGRFSSPAALVCHSVWRELPDYLLRTGCRADGENCLCLRNLCHPESDLFRD